MLRVLIADNNVDLCQTLEEFLNNEPDIQVVGVAYDGEQALHQVQELVPDVLLLDITMPHLDGMAVLERLNAMKLPRPPRVIVLTALGREDIIQLFTDLGADYFIVKPFDLEVLAERIRQFGGEPAGNNGASMVRESREPRYGHALELEAKVTNLLQEMGLPPHFKGYHYLRDAVVMVLQEDALLGGALTKKLYPRLADKYGTTPGGVEAAIRNAIIAAWQHGNREFLETLTGATGGRRGKFPTNSMVIARLADHLRLSPKAS